jgi:hypothetical protein
VRVALPANAGGWTLILLDDAGGLHEVMVDADAAMTVRQVTLASEWVEDFERFFGGGLRHLTSHRPRRRGRPRAGLTSASAESGGSHPGL